jgi:hypothetical protein
MASHPSNASLPGTLVRRADPQKSDRITGLMRCINAIGFRELKSCLSCDPVERIGHTLVTNEH